jgi:hypothetical protein
MTDPSDDFVQMWEWFSTHCEGYSPLYARISLAVAGDPEVIQMVRSTPPEAHLPPALLAAVHYLLLGGLDHPLADVYAGRSEADPGPLFVEVCHQRRDEIVSLLETRRIQTNECGRSAVLAPGITWVAGQFRGPYALVDVGASAGINLLCDQFRINYGAHGATGPADAPVHIACQVVGGHPPIAERLPALVSRVGIDRSPINLADPDDARWLLACVWPDTGRLERTAAAIHLAHSDLPTVVAGEANDVLPDVLTKLPDGVTAIVVTTWAFAYFPTEDRGRFVQLLSDVSLTRPIAWLSAEGAGTVEALAGAIPAESGGLNPDVLGAVLFEQGERRAQVLANVQEHGNWIDWRD